MQIETISIDEVHEYERNPRVNEPAVNAVAGSIKEFGFKVPIIVDRENVIVAGHTRVRAARKLELTEIPVVRADDLTPEQIRAFRVADNKLHELSTWNLEMLATELGELKTLDVDLYALGSNGDERDNPFAGFTFFREGRIESGFVWHISCFSGATVWHFDNGRVEGVKTVADCGLVR